MQLPNLQSLPVENKKVLLRADLDFAPEDTENLRLKALLPTLDYLQEKGAKIILVGHRGRPAGKTDESLSLKLFEKVFAKWNVEVLENLRFNPGEEANDEEFAKELAAKGEVFINEAFAASHRQHASIVRIPQLLPHAAGIRFVAEIEHLSQVFENAKRPVVAIISGLKEDKLSYVPDFKKFSDKILLGGRLPEYIHDGSPLRTNTKIAVADLTADKEDITMHSIEGFEKEIALAGTIVLSGPLGKFEDEGHRQGTARVFQAVANSSAFKIAGGGDTLIAIKLLNLEDKFDWLSVGGGASLQFLAKGTLPGIQALLG
jgi:phosphoglycerate kinase